MRSLACAASALAVVLGISGLVAVTSCAQQQPTPQPPAPRRVVIAKELMITDLSVVESNLATSPDGPWTFGRLFRDLCPTDADAKNVLLDWLRSWESTQTLNGDTSPARPTIRTQLIDPWKLRDGQTGVSDAAWNVNWNHAPMRLLAIVNRIDLRREDGAGTPLNAGEGRFVFCVHNNQGAESPASIDNGGAPLPFTIILEYGQPASTEQDVLAWAAQWHALGSQNFGPGYNSALEAITRRFAGRNAASPAPNGSTSALNQLRTNENQLNPLWELREFQLAGTPVRLKQVTVKQTPRNALDASAALGTFIAAHVTELKAGTLDIDRDGFGTNFLGVASQVPFGFVWDAPAPLDNDARHGLAFQTCNGCHHRETAVDKEVSIAKVGRGFVHISPRQRGEVTQLSGFLEGVSAPDPVTGIARPFADLRGRAIGLEDLLGIPHPAPSGPRVSASQETRRVRVH